MPPRPPTYPTTQTDTRSYPAIPHHAAPLLHQHAHVHARNTMLPPSPYTSVSHPRPRWLRLQPLSPPLPDAQTHAPLPDL